MPIIDFTNVEKVYRGSIEMKKVYEGQTVVWEKQLDNKSIPLYIELVNPSDTVPLQVMASGTTNKTLAYSYDNQTWTAYTATNNPYTIQLNSSNPRVYFRATTNAQWSSSNTIYWYFRKYITANDVPLKVGGNIFSLENTGTSYQTVISPSGIFDFFRLFQNFTCLTDASNLFLGIKTTTLKANCYQAMFLGCTSLTQAPMLPTTTLSTYCYNGMFSGCTSLTQAPELPATTLAARCYEQMFYNCTSLNYIKCLATNISATNCLSDWVSGVASSGTFVKASSMTSWPTGASGIPSGWTIQNA